MTTKQDTTKNERTALNDMTQSERHEFEIALTRTILAGSSIADTGEINGIGYPVCRDILHRCCRRLNRGEYDRINVISADKGEGSPHLNLIRESKEAFTVNMPKVVAAPTRTQEQVKRDMHEAEGKFQRSKTEMRFSRSKLDQLKAELDDLSN